MRFLLASTALALLALPLAARAEESADKLVPVLRSRLVFDGVATTKDGRIFLPFRRQTPDQGIEVGEWVDGQPKPSTTVAIFCMDSYLLRVGGRWGQVVASIETTLELWASSLRDVKGRIRPLFTQERVAVSAGQFLDGLLGNEQRKTGWMRAEAVGDPGPWRQQAILGRGRWDADALRDVVRDYVMEHLSDDEAVLVIDETGFLKQGKSSCGVSRQYTGSAGKITNCQIGVFADYVSCHGHAFIDRALYLPKSWTDDRFRLDKAHVPPEVSFATKPQMAVAMIERALAAGVPFRWVAADSVYGVGALETALRRRDIGYVLGVSRNSQFNSWGKTPAVTGTAEEIAAGLDETAWQRLSAGQGTKGPRLYDWAYRELADLDAPARSGGPTTGLWTRGLLIRRTLADGALAYFSTWCPQGTGIAKLVEVEGHRWSIEDDFETGKNEIGLDHNETRSWHGWQRHVSLSMLALAMMAAIRRQANLATHQKKLPRMAKRLSS